MDTQPQTPAPQPPAQQQLYGKGYGKRPLWQWIVMYVVVGGIIYYGIYYFAIAKKGGNTSNTNTTTSSSPY